MHRLQPRPRSRTKRSAKIRLFALAILCAIAFVALEIFTQQHLFAAPQSVVIAKKASHKQSDSWKLPDRYKGRVIGLQPRSFGPKFIALTFDDGPDPKLTPQILRILKQYNAKATFFVLGMRASKQKALLRQIVREGHTIGNHTFSHLGQATPEVAAYEVANTKEIIERAIGRETNLFRPPYGHRYNTLSMTALDLGYTLALWSLPSRDTSHLSAKQIASVVLNTRKRGDIVVMHDGPGHAQTVAALPTILKGLSKRGYKFVTLPEMLREYDSVLTARDKRKPTKVAPQHSSYAALARKSASNRSEQTTSRQKLTKKGAAAMAVATTAITSSDGTK